MSRARLFEVASVAVFGFRRSNRRKQTRLRQGSKRVNSALGGAVSSVRSHREARKFLEIYPILHS